MGLLHVLTGIVLAAGIASSSLPAWGEPAEPKASFFEVVNLTADDGEALADFGESTALSGDTLVIGSPGFQDIGTDSGVAYIFQRGAADPNSWRQVVKLVASDRGANDIFGLSVAISGDTVVVGAEHHDDLGFASGAAYIFERHLGGLDNWGQIAELTASDGEKDDRFGRGVAISGDTVVIGASGDDVGTSSGSAYIFERHFGGPNSWGQVAKINASNGVGIMGFGSVTKISGDTIVVGASRDGELGDDSGAAYVFQRDATNPSSWGQVAKLLASDGASHDGFGGSVAISGDTVVVGAMYDDDIGPESGSAYIFERDAGGSDNWGQVLHLTAPDGMTRMYFGESVGIADDRVVVGSIWDDDLGSKSGSAYIFQRDAGDPGNWLQVAKIVASDGRSEDEFGDSIALGGGTVIVGAPWNDDRGYNSGSAYVYQETTVDPFLTVTGTCPGEITFHGVALTPRGLTDMAGSLAEGNTEITQGPCQGTFLSLHQARVLLRNARNDDLGSGTFVLSVGPNSCGTYLQIQDRTSCAVSNVARIPGEP